MQSLVSVLTQTPVKSHSFRSSAELFYCRPHMPTRANGDEASHQAEIDELKRQLETKQGELDRAKRVRNSMEKRAKDAEAKLAEFESQRKKYGKLPSSTLDAKAKEIALRWSVKYDPNDICMLALAAWRCVATS